MPTLKPELIADSFLLDKMDSKERTIAPYIDRREEVRGLFVLGVIAVLIVLHSDQALFPFARVLVDTLLMFWVGYAILTVIGLSEDVFGRRVSTACYLSGLYALGCAIAYCLSFALLYLGTNAVVALIMRLGSYSCPYNDLQGLFLCVLGAFFVFLAVFFIGFVPALFVPPVIIAWRMSRRYGKMIWKICACMLIVDTAATLLWFSFLLKMFGINLTWG